MVESFVSGMTGYNSDGEEIEEDLPVEMLLDHSFGRGKIQGLAYCEEIEVLAIGFADGSVHTYHFEVELLRDERGQGEDSSDDEYGGEEQYRQPSVIKGKAGVSGSKVILKRTFEQMEGPYCNDTGSLAAES
jgi:hypothetical protein